MDGMDMDEIDMEEIDMNAIDGLDTIPGLGDELTELDKLPSSKSGSRVGGYALIGEGNANKVFRNLETGKLIRVSKNGVDVARIVEYWNAWKPKLGKYMKNIRVYEDSLYGKCLEIDEIDALCQFKPKWLAQSSSAPSNALSCRTCAIKRMRQQPNSWCALDLGVNDADGIKKLVNTMQMNPKYMDAVVSSLINSQIFPVLKQQQLQSYLEDAMTLRDVTVLIEKRTFKPFIVDLDPKQFKPKWTDLEEQLIPYYLERSDVCRLSRTHKRDTKGLKV